MEEGFGRIVVEGHAEELLVLPLQHHQLLSLPQMVQYRLSGIRNVATEISHALHE